MLALIGGWLLSFLRLLLLTSLGLTSTAPDDGPPAATPATDAEWSLVGAVFNHNSTDGHNCTGSVVHSSSGDAVLTAAHCVTGPAAEMRFAPGYRDARPQDGMWRVQAVYFPDGWLDHQDPASDIAVLRLAPRSEDGSLGSVEDAVGSATLGPPVQAGDHVTVVGYPADQGGAVRCSNVVEPFEDGGATLNSVYCKGFSNGTSGSPWLTVDDGQVDLVGLIGGVHQGGCTDDRSYTTPLEDQVAPLVDRVDAAAASDPPPDVPSNGC